MATFLKYFVTKNFKKSPKLVTLLHSNLDENLRHEKRNDEHRSPARRQAFINYGQCDQIVRFIEL